MKALRSLLCLAGLSFPLCGAQPPMQGEPAKEAVFFPLKKGNQWTYKAGQDTVVVKVEGTKKIGTEDAWELVTSVGGTPHASEYVVQRADGFYRVQINTTKVEPPICFFKFGTKKGDSWTVESKLGKEELKGKFALGEEEITFNKNKYKALTVSGVDMLANGQKMTLTYWFAEKVGVVKQSANLAGVPILLELTKFEESR